MSCTKTNEVRQEVESINTSFEKSKKVDNGDTTLDKEIEKIIAMFKKSNRYLRYETAKGAKEDVALKLEVMEPSDLLRIWQDKMIFSLQNFQWTKEQKKVFVFLWKKMNIEIFDLNNDAHENFKMDYVYKYHKSVEKNFGPAEIYSIFCCLDDIEYDSENNEKVLVDFGGFFDCPCNISLGWYDCYQKRGYKQDCKASNLCDKTWTGCGFWGMWRCDGDC